MLRGSRRIGAQGAGAEQVGPVPGGPRKMEPDRCCRIGFFPEDVLLSPLLPEVADTLTARDETAFSVAGRTDEPAPVG
ncbi:hypothetical protein [Streptomyces sp. NPDC086838]|uniref:hypothetical protein n=1 Tax=Streptomyces sp. NPDC086838 TaxID=3365762 RepID=UPI0038140E16